MSAFPPPPDGFQVVSGPPAPSSAPTIPPPPAGFQVVGAGAGDPLGQHAAGDSLRARGVTDPHQIGAAYDAYRQNALGQTAPVQTLTPEMAARQQMGQENQARDMSGSFGAAQLTNFNGLAGRFQKTLASGVGLVAPGMAQNMRIAAERTEDINGSANHPIATGAGALIGGLPATFAGPLGAVLSAGNVAENTYHNIEERRDNGEKIGAGAAASDVILQSGINYLMNRLGQKNMTGPLAGQAVKMVMPELESKFGTISATLIARAALEGGTQATQGIASNAATKATIDPKQDVMEGAGQNLALGAGLGVGGNLMHSAASRLFKPRAQAPEAPAQVVRPAEQKTQAENPQPAQEVQAQDRGDQQPVNEVPHTSDTRQYTGPSEAEKHLDLYAKAKSEFNTPDGNNHAAMDQRQPARLEAGQATAQARQNENPQDQIGNPPRDGQVQADPERDANPQPHPAELKDAAAVGKWYGDTFHDSQNAGVIEAMASMHNGGYRLADVPSRNLDTLNFQAGDKDPAKVQAIQNLPDAERAKLPPVIAVPGGPGRLAVADGSHRTLAAQASGQESVRAYVPDSYIGKNGVKEVEAPAAPQPGKKSVFSKVASDESGGAKIPPAAGKLMERDVIPAVAKNAEATSKTWESLNRAVGTGLNLDTKARDTALNIRTSLGKLDLDRTRLEADLKPHRDVLEKMSDSQKTQWVDQVEAIGESPDKATQPAADLLTKLNRQNITEGEKYGLNTKKWDENWIGRTFEFPQETGKGTPGNRSSLAGPQTFLKHRTFDTFGEAKAFVEANGGKAKYSNPLDMALAKQIEVNRSIAARKTLYSEEDRGMMKWVPEGESLPENMTTKLNDPLARQEREVIAPKWMVGKLASLAHYDAQRYLESPEWKGKSQILRPGDKIPEGMVKTGEKVPGQFAADQNVAGLFNNLISPGVTKAMPIWDQIVKAKRGVVAMNLGFSGVHAVLESIGNAVQSVGRSLSNIGHGEFDLAAKNLARANPIKQAMFGKQIREQAANAGAHPELEKLVQTSVQGGNKFAIKSVLDSSDWQRAKEEWDAGNTIGSAGRALKAIYAKTHQPLFEHFIPALRAGAKAAEAEMAIRRGLTGDELQRHMGLAQDDIDNILGTVIRTHQFQNKIVTDVQDLLFTAPKFTEGTLRFAGAATRDTIKGLSDLAHGKTPKITPAQWTALSGLAVHAIGGALTQLAYTYATTGKAQMPSKLQDYIAPRTGRQDDQGRDERITLLSPFSALFSFAKGGAGALGSRVAPIWHGVKDVATNSDWRGVQVHDPNAGFLKQRAQDAQHLGKTMLPFSVQNMIDQKRPGASKTLDAKVGDVIGAKFSHTAATDAEQAARDVIYSHHREAPISQAEDEHTQAVRGLADEVRGDKQAGWKDARQAAKDGTINPSDMKAVANQATEKPGLQGLLKHSGLSAGEIMQQVWPKMTPEERRQNQWLVRGRIGRAEKLSPADKQTWFKQIQSDVKAAQQR